MAESPNHDPWCPWDEDAPTSVCQCKLIAKIRADEREKSDTHLRLLYNIDSLHGERVALWRAYAEMLADLRAKVQALRDRPIASFDGYTGRDALDQVLALLGGGSDE